jgi:hypothetical protein
MALTLGAGKILPQDPTRLGVGVDVLVDRFLAHGRPTLQSGSFANRLRRPALFEPRLGIDPHLVSESTRAWPLGLGLRLLVRLFRSVAAQPQIAHKLPANATRSPAQKSGHLSQTDILLTPAVDEIAFFFGYACVSHVVLLVLWHNTKNVAYRAWPFLSISVAIAGRARDGLNSDIHNKALAPKNDETIAGTPNRRTIFLFDSLPTKINLNKLLEKWTIAVNAMAISKGKNIAKTGIKRVPKPNPEKKVKPEARRAVIQIIR